MPRRWGQTLNVGLFSLCICLLVRVGCSLEADNSGYEPDEEDLAPMRALRQQSLEPLVPEEGEEFAGGASKIEPAAPGQPPAPTRQEELAINISQTALLQVIALSWPSEGPFGLKVQKNFPPTSPRRYSWLQAQRRSFQILADADMKTREAPTEEVLLALGYRYLHGIGTRRDCFQALSCYNSVAESVAQYMEENDQRETKLDLGLMRISLSEIDGILGEEDEEVQDSVQFDLLSAQGGDIWAQKEVGWRALVGRGLEENHEQAMEHLEQAAGVGDPDAIHNLGYMHMNGLGVPQNYTKAKEYFDEAAQHNITAAFNALGFMYYRGVGVPRNLSQGEHYLRQAADREDADAAFNLAALYQDVDGNMSRAFAFLEQAADAGFWRALLAVADVYDLGIEKPRNCTAAVESLKKLVETYGGVANDLREGVAMYQKGERKEAQQVFCELAEQGVEVAQSNCAWLYYKGTGLDPPANETLRMQAVRRMLERGAQQGGADAMLRLADMDWYGQGRPRNVSSAVERYRVASARRSQQAAYAMGYLHQFGIGVERNLTLARRMYLKSGTKDHFTRFPSHLALAVLRAQEFVEALLPPLTSLHVAGLRLVPEHAARHIAALDGVELSTFSLFLILASAVIGLMLLITCGTIIGYVEGQTNPAQGTNRRVPDLAQFLDGNVDVR